MITLFTVEEQAVKISSGEVALLDRGLCVLVWKMSVCGTTVSDAYGDFP